MHQTAASEEPAPQLEPTAGGEASLDASAEAGLAVEGDLAASGERGLDQGLNP